MRANHLSAGQILQIQAVSRTMRDGNVFVDTVLSALSKRRSMPTNDEVSAAISDALGTVPMYFTDAATTPTEATMAKVFHVGDTADEREMRRRELAGLPVLDDGDRLHVGVRFMDAVDNNTRAAIERAKRSTDAGAGHRPGYRILRDAAALDAKQRAYDEHRRYIENAYRGDYPVSGVSDRVKVDAAMTKDEAYRLYDENLGRQWAIGKSETAIRAGDGVTRDAAYKIYEEELRQAYLNPTSE